MKRALCHLAFSLSLLLASALPSSAQLKIATVDFRKVFDGYYKTKQADLTLKERGAEFDKSKSKMFEDYQKANEQYKKLLEESNDQAVTSEEREKRRKSAEARLLEIKEIEQSITLFDRQSRTTMGEQLRRMKENLLREVREVIIAQAKSGNFSHVFDTSGESFNAAPVLLYTSGDNDLTESVLKEINANAPASQPVAVGKNEKK